MKEYRGCKHNDTGVWHFCCVHGDIIYPVGACRENNKRDSINPPCEHKTEKECEDCFEKWEASQVMSAAIFADDDIIFPSNKALFAKLQAEKDTK